jgi:hypothetical protein
MDMKMLELNNSNGIWETNEARKYDSREYQQFENSPLNNCFCRGTETTKASFLTPKATAYSSILSDYMK